MSSRVKKILTFGMIFLLLFLLTSCGRSASDPKPILTSWGDAKFFDYLLVIPVSFIMQFFAGIFGNNFAAGIIFTTIIIRTLAWPIYAKSNDMSIKMQLMQPDIQRVQAKYEGRQDPESQQKQRIEMANIYKKHNFSPLGCLMPFLQMPIFIAVYQSVIRITVEGGKWVNKVSNTNFLGIDLSKAGNFDFFKEGFIASTGWHGVLLAILVFGTNILLTYLASRKPKYLKETHKHKPQSDQAEQQQKMMQMMPYIFAIMMFGIALTSNSLALYWIVGNLYSIIQSTVSKKINEKKYYKLRNQDLVVKSK